MSAEGWAVCRLGHQHWGRYGAAGLLLIADGAALLELRALHVDRGGTWGLPGGALLAGESPADGAVREACEETTLDDRALTIGAQDVDDHGGWSYTTVLAQLARRAPVRPRGHESVTTEWVPLALVPRRTLHPDLAAGWLRLQALAAR